MDKVCPFLYHSHTGTKARETSNGRGGGERIRAPQQRRRILLLRRRRQPRVRPSGVLAHCSVLAAGAELLGRVEGAAAAAVEAGGVVGPAHDDPGHRHEGHERRQRGLGRKRLDILRALWDREVVKQEASSL